MYIKEVPVSITAVVVLGDAQLAKEPSSKVSDVPNLKPSIDNFQKK